MKKSQKEKWRNKDGDPIAPFSNTVNRKKDKVRKATTSKKLRPAEELFVQAYLANGCTNARQAALDAGYSQKSAAKAHKWVTEERCRSIKPHVWDLVYEETRSLLSKAEDKKERIVEELTSLAFANMGDYVIFNGGNVSLVSSEDLTREQLAAIESVSETKDGVRFKLHSKVDAIDKLAKMLGLMSMSVNHRGPNGGPVQVSAEISVQSLTDKELEAVVAAGGEQLDGPSNSDD